MTGDNAESETEIPRFQAYAVFGIVFLYTIRWAIVVSLGLLGVVWLIWPSAPGLPVAAGLLVGGAILLALAVSLGWVASQISLTVGEFDAYE